MADIENKPHLSFWKKFLKLLINSPIRSIFILALLYFGVQAFVFSQTLADKIAFFAVIGVWILFFVAKQIFLFLVLVCLLGGGAYLYYDYTHREAKQCEQNGGYWNNNTQTCEEKKSSWERLKAFWERNKQKHETNTEKEIKK